MYLWVLVLIGCGCGVNCVVGHKGKRTGNSAVVVLLGQAVSARLDHAHHTLITRAASSVQHQHSRSPLPHPLQLHKHLRHTLCTQHTYLK